MRLIHQDPKSGLLKLRIETPSDLWRIARLVHPGELAGASTTRRDPEAPEDSPAAQRERRRVWLVVRAEQVEFHGFSKHVRITGPIVEGPFDLGRHHTLDVGDGDELTIQKESLPAGDRALLEEGIESKGDPRVLIASVDWGESTFVRLHGRVIEPVADVNRTIAGKRYAGGQGEKDREAYMESLIDVVTREAPSALAIVVCGPGFLKEHLAKAIAEKVPAAKGKVKVYPTGEGGRSGVDELLRSGKASEALRGSAAAEEADLVERLVTALGGGKRAAVGRAEVTEASHMGALETLLVSESLLTEPAVVEVLDMARAARARIFVVRDEGAAGKRMTGVGGIGALLRFDWSPAAGRNVGPKGGPGRLP
ncbi:MAG: hypothetical protein L3K09_00765 [Thermoplasmata archaeon]|nr:hypothetical protein [Thermoplasmata archaeon]